MKLPNLTVRWPLNGTQRGAALQTAAAAKFLQWRPTITPTQAQIYRQAEGRAGEGSGGGHRMGCDGDVRLRWVVQDNCKSLHLTESVLVPLWTLFLDGCSSEKKRFAATTKPNLLIFISHLLNKKFQQKLFQ